jgi:hypothetical protein
MDRNLTEADLAVIREMLDQFEVRTMESIAAAFAPIARGLTICMTRCGHLN